MAKPLIKSYEHIDVKSFPDAYLSTAHEIEVSLISAGAVPGKDYSYLDLYQLAQPFVVDLFKNGKIS